MGRCRSFAVSLTLAVLLLRGFLPAGWMPDTQAGFTICSIDGAHHGAPGDRPAKQDHGDTVCPFAAAAHLSPPAVAGFVLLLRQEIYTPSSAGFVTIALSLPRHEPHAPRAPPFSA